MNNDQLTSLARDAIDVEMAVFEMDKDLGEMSQTTGDPRINDRLKKLKTIKQATEDIQETVRVQRNENKQALLMNSFEIVGIPDGAVENTEDLADILSKVLNVPVEENTIAGFESLDPEPIPQYECQPAKVTAVHMTDRCYRDRIIHLAGSSPLRLNDAEEPLFIRDHLTRMNKMILRKTMNRAAMLNISKVWVNEGMIFIRKTESSPVVQIRCDEDIEKMHLY